MFYDEFNLSKNNWFKFIDKLLGHSVINHFTFKSASFCSTISNLSMRTKGLHYLRISVHFSVKNMNIDLFHDNRLTYQLGSFVPNYGINHVILVANFDSNAYLNG